MKEIQNDHIGYLEILDRSNFHWTLNEKFLEYVSKNFNYLTEFYPLISFCILQFYLRWIYLYKKGKKAKYIESLLNCLLQISRPINFSIFAKIQNLALSAFFYSFIEYINLFEEAQFPNLLNNLRSLFATDILLPKEAFFLLSKTTETIVCKSPKIKDEYVYQMFDYIQQLCCEMGDQIPCETINDIITSILSKLSDLDEKALILFSYLSKNVSEVAHIFELFANSIDRTIREHSPFISLSEKIIENENIQLPPVTSPEVTLRFWDTPVFKKGINLKPNIKFPYKKNYKELVPPYLIKTLDLIIDAAHQREEFAIKILDSFSSLVIKIKDDYKVDSCCVFLYVCLKLIKFIRCSDVLTILLEKPFFDPDITVFNQYTDYDTIDSLRTGVIDVVLSHMQCFDQVLVKWVQFPLLFAEIIHRVIRNPQLHVDRNVVQPISKGLMITSMYYQTLHYSMYDCKETSSIEIARTSLFLLITQLLQLPDASSLLFSNSIFVSFFISFIFEVPLRDFVLSKLLSFLTKQQEMVSCILEGMLVQIVQICAPLFPEEKFVILVLDLLTTLTEALIHQRNITKYFEPLCNPIFSTLNGLNNSELSQNYVLQCIQFFALTAVAQNVSNLQVSELENAIQIVFNENIPQQLTNKLIQMIAGEVLPSLTPTFIIRQPKILTLFLKISLKDNKLLDTIHFLDQLCQFSALNCQRCHISEFDHYLIDLIIEMKDSPIEIIQAILNLFQRIASTMSSVSIVQRFISLLSPRNGRTMPLHIKHYLSTINSIALNASRLPISSLPLTENSAKIEVQGLNSYDLVNGFTFVFWINADTSLNQYKPNILTLTDSRGNFLRWFLSYTNMFCTQRSVNFESNGKVDAPLPLSTWTFVAVTLKEYIEEGITEMRTIYGCKETKPLEFVTMKLHPGPISCTIGGVTPNSSPSELISRLGAIGLFHELTDEQITSIYEMGPRVTGQLSVQPFFFYQIDEDKCQLILKVKYSKSNIDAKISSAPIRFNTTFTDILINFCKAAILLPLYSELDMLIENGDNFPNLVKLVTELFSNTLIISKYAQDSFRRAKGFAIISHLLLSASSKHSDYSLYLQFFSMMQSFTSIRLQANILRNILLNMNIWIRSDAENHLRIIKHWARVLFPSLKSFLSKLISFQDILYLMRVYYWYEQVNEEKDYIMIERGDEFNISECRQLLSHCALIMSTEKFTVEDYQCLASHCTTCGEMKQIPDLLRLLKSITTFSPSPLIHILSQIDIVYFLYGLFNKHNEEINVLVVEIIISFHKYEILKGNSLQQHLVKLQGQFSPSNINESIFKQLVNLMSSSYPEMLPLCSFVSMKLDENLVEWFIHQLKPNEEYCIDISWCMWPVILCYHHISRIQKLMLQFFVKLPDSHWPNIFAMIINIGLILNEESAPIVKSFLLLISNDERMYNENTASIFFKLCTYYLFSPSKTQIEQMFKFVFESSIFTSTFPPRSVSSILTRTNHFSPNSVIPPQKNTYKVSDGHIDHNKEHSKLPQKFHSLDIREFLNESHKMSNVMEKINNFSVPFSVNRFSVRFDRKMKWTDIDIAKLFANMFAPIRNKSFMEAYLVILAYILREDLSFVESHLDHINLSNDEIHQYEPAIDLINHHVIKNGSNQLLTNKTSHEIDEGAFNCVQQHRFMQQNEISHLCITSFFKLKDLTQNAMRNLKIINYPELTFCQAQLSDGFNKNVRQKDENRREWMKLWRCLAIDHAPWDCNTHGEAHFKRDNTFCAYFCPFKIKRNWKFDDHKKSIVSSSKSNDSLNHTDSIDSTDVPDQAAEQAIKDDLEHRASRYNEHTPSPLLEISDTDNSTQDDRQDNKNSQLKKVILEAPCEYITPTTTTKHEINGTFYLTKEFIKIVFAATEHRPPKVVLLSEIQHLFFRRSYHRPNSIEIFTTNGRCYYIHFHYHNSLPILKKISSLSLPNAIHVQTVDFYQYFQAHNITEKWIHGEISNFEYIIHLNMMSGRTFNDLTQYPLFPWTYGVYTGNKPPLLNISSNFRDMSKPIGALNDDRLAGLVKRYKQMEIGGIEPYMYDTGNINVLSACLYLLRLEPFTSEHVSFQDGKFDNPSRLFSSISRTFTQVVTRQNDYREMIPEFFFMPEFLLNLNHYDLGTNNNGDVKLPEWAKTADEFIYLQRKGLESEFVSQVLNRWIDLIWGIKQHSPLNSFRPEMYEDIWNESESLSDPKRRAFIENTLLHVGQVPPQLFKEPHPTKMAKTLPKQYFKQPYLIRPPTNATSNCSGSLPVSFSCVEDLTNLKYKVTVVTSDGTLTSHFADFSRLKIAQEINLDGLEKEIIRRQSIPQSVSDTSLHFLNNLNDTPLSVIKDVKMTFTTKRIHKYDEYKIDFYGQPNSFAQLLHEKVAVISNSTYKVMIVDVNTGNIELMPNQTSDAVAIASTRDMLAIAGNDAVLNIYKCTDSNAFKTPIMTMPSYRDSISCVCISQTFFVAVIGTRDGSLIINSLNKGSTVRVIDLEGAKPCLVIVTSGWGFIVTYATKLKQGKLSHYLYVFNINGIQLRKKKISFGIIAWSHWTSNSGFDYMLVSDERGKLFAFEVFYLDIDESFFRCHSPVSSLNYLNDLQAVVVVAKDGRILFIPYSIEFG